MTISEADDNMDEITTHYFAELKKEISSSIADPSVPLHLMQECQDKTLTLELLNLLEDVLDHKILASN